MYIQRGKKTFFVMFLVIFPLLAMAASTQKTEEAAVPQVPDLSVKCGECPCSESCNQQLPPPPPPKCTTPRPPATPPPPRFVYFTGSSPPPPPPRFVYYTGPPGGWNYLYPTDNPFDLKIYSGTLRRHRRNAAAFISGIMLFMVILFF